VDLGNYCRNSYFRINSITLFAFTFPLEPMELSTKIEEIPKVGRFASSRLSKLGIKTVGDLLYHFPFRYEEIGLPQKISDLKVGELASAKGTVIEVRNIVTRYRKFLTKILLNDGTGTIEAVWFNQPFLTKILKENQKISLAGKIDLFSSRLTFINPEYEILDYRKKPLHTQGYIPIYPETSGLTSKWIRSRIAEVLPSVLPKVKEIFPNQTIKRNNLISAKRAISQIHQPATSKQIREARKRLAFEEILLSQLKSLEKRMFLQKNENAAELKTHQEQILSVISNLPFTLTTSQKKVLKEIISDLSRKRPMNRLLQGDVGSGKTVVAAIASYEVFLNGFKTTLMAPTEILAIQHFNTFRAILGPLGVKVGLHTATKKLKGEFDILIGTHALLFSTRDFEKIAFIVIDEQHRFGVEQRAILRNKILYPHVLTMTATPIPRSLALTFYGDLDISIMDMLPSGRYPVKTYLVPPTKRNNAYQFIRDRIAAGDQAFIICPLVDPSETLESVKAATYEYEILKKGAFSNLSVGILHGRMKTKEKEETLHRFLKGDLQILVATPIVEVGIDIPNATIMMVEGSERFGLSSLHQLRGRVGRSDKQSYCLLFTESNSPQVRKRLEALVKYNNGLKLAEIDLEMRGPGQLHGVEQSGLLDFKIATLSDLTLITATRIEAQTIIKKLKSREFTTLRSKLRGEKPISPD